MDARIGIVLLTHGGAAPAFLGAIARLCGPPTVEGLVAVPIDPSADRPLIEAALRDAVSRADNGAGVVIACDLVGSTPWNCAVELRGGAAADHPVEIVSGLSLAMAIRLASGQRVGTTPTALAQAALESVQRCLRVGAGT